MNKPQQPLDSYMRHIAHANIYKEVLDNLNDNNNEQQ